MFNKNKEEVSIKDVKSTLKKLLKYMKKYQLSLIIIFLFAIGSSIFSIVGPKVLGNATTILFEGYIEKVTGVGNIDFQAINTILITLIILYVISAIFSYIQSFLMSSVAQKVTYQLRKEINAKVNKMPLSFFESKKHGEVQSIIVNDIDTLSQGLNQSAAQLITSITTLLGIFVMMLSINVTITLVTLLIIPISLFIVSRIVKRSQKYFSNQQKYLGKLNGHIEEIYTNHTVVKAFNANKKVMKTFDTENEKLYEAGWKSQFVSGIMQPIINFIGNISYVVVAIIGAIYASRGIITVGEIQSFIQYSKNFSNPISQLAQISTMLQSTIASAERIFEFIESEEEIKDKKDAKTTEKIVGNVTFKNVSFGYQENQTIIKDLTAVAKKGQKVAIVGPTGAGKTTIIKLLMRYYDVTAGAITIDDIDIKDIKRSELRKLFGMVLQDTWLFNGTIMDNIRYGNLSSSDEEVISAAKTAHIDHYIKALPDGYQMIINEETNNISSGQKQLLTIARAILANPKILILDEATSNVDTRTELLIQKSMDELMKGRTSFIIAHRLSTIKNADIILVMKDGNIIEQGNHIELMKKKGFYCDLYQSQFEK